MIYTIVLLVLSILLIALLMWLLNKQLKKVEKAETVLNSTYVLFNEALEELRRLDRIGAFESDDETGFIFDQIKLVIKTIEHELIKESEKENAKKEK